MIKAAEYRIGGAILLAAVMALTGLVAGLMPGLGAGNAVAATLEVGGKNGFKTIAKALERAKQGDVVVIKPGTKPPAI